MDGSSVNPILDYVQKLTLTKKGLPFAQPVCVLASLAITTTAGLLKLAAEVGPHITILQIQADSIEDWNQDSIDQLVLVSKKYGFILWEGSRILNATFAVPQREAESTQSDMNRALIEMIKRRYTGGSLKAASWSGITTSWAASVPYNHQEKDLLMPSLRKAARQVVAITSKTIQTEISAANSEPASEQLEVPMSPPPTNNGWSEFSGDNMGFALRKLSTISVTETVVNQPHVQTDDGIPPPPSLSRGMALCLPPSSVDSAFTPEFRQTTIVAACANPDFVVGLVTADPSFCNYRGNTLLELACEGNQGVYDDKGNSILLSSPYIETENNPALFSLVPPDLIQDYDENNQNDDDSGSVVASKLFHLMDRALKLREANRKAYTSNASHQSGPKLYHIPVVVLP